MRRLFAALAILVSLVPLSAKAFTFTPTAVDVTLNPVEIKTAEFVAKNESSEARTYLIDLQGVTFSADGSPIFSEIPSAVASWLSVDSAIFTLQPTEERTVQVTVSPSADAQPASFIFAVILREDEPSGSGVTVDTAISGLVFVTVGDVVAEATLLQFSASHGVTGGLPITYSAIFRNDGERVLQPWGLVTVTNMFGKEVAILDVNGGKFRVLPNRARTYEIVWEMSQRRGFFGELWREVSDLRVGVFTATLTVEPYPGAAEPIVTTARVLFVPWRAMLVCAIGGAGVLFAQRRRRR